MDIFEYAMKVEKEGELYYRQLQGSAPVAGLKNIFGWLAEAETEHFKIFQAMKEGAAFTLKDSPLLDRTKTVFEQMRQAKEFSFTAPSTQAYRKAQEIEERMKTFYRQKAKESADARQRETLLAIAGEEEKHYRLLEGIIEFVTRPQQWLENAEWYQLQEY